MAIGLMPKPPQPPENVERSDLDCPYASKKPSIASFMLGLFVLCTLVGVIITFFVIAIRETSREKLKVEALSDKPDRYIVEVQKVTNCFRITTIHDTKTKKTFVSMDDGVHLTQVEP